MTSVHRSPGTVADLSEMPIEQQLAALEHQMESERLQLSLVPDALHELRTELAAVERTLDQNYTYVFPLTRRRLKAQAGDLHRRIALQAIELEELQQRYFHPTGDTH